MAGTHVMSAYLMERQRQGQKGDDEGEGKGLDACNIFAKVVDEDLKLLKELGEEIWKQGAQQVTFERG